MTVNILSVNTVFILSVTKYSLSELYRYSEDWRWSEGVPDIYQINGRRSPQLRYKTLEERIRSSSVGEWRWRENQQNRNELYTPKLYENYEEKQPSGLSLDDDYLMKWMKSYVERIKKKRGFNLDKSGVDKTDDAQIPVYIGQQRQEEPGVSGRAVDSPSHQQWRWRDQDQEREVVIHMKRNRNKNPRIATNRQVCFFCRILQKLLFSHKVASVSFSLGPS